MESSAITINADLVAHFTKNYSIKSLHAYCMAVYTMRQLGYMHKEVFLEKFAHNLSCSQQTAYRWLSFLKKNKIINEKKGVLYILGKKAYLKQLGIYSRLHFKASWEDLNTFSSFRKLCIVQSGLRLQERFRYNLKKIIKNTGCPLLMERIEFPVSHNPKKVGCSSSYLAKFLGISKSSASKVLVGSTIKNYEYLGTITYPELSSLYCSGYFIEHYRIKCFIKNNIPTLYYTLPSIITSDKKFCRRGIKPAKNIHSYGV